MLYLTHFAVHSPIQAKKDLVAKYAAKEPGLLHHNLEMATMIQAVDDSLGKIVQALEQLEIRDNTVIIFYSDNGGYGPATDMDPLKGYKGTYYEGGIRVPFFVNWPGTVEPAQRSEEPVIGVDIYPTLCEIGDVPLPKNQVCDGLSLVRLFKGEVVNWTWLTNLASYFGTFRLISSPTKRFTTSSVIRCFAHVLAAPFGKGVGS